MGISDKILEKFDNMGVVGWVLYYALLSAALGEAVRFGVRSSKIDNIEQELKLNISDEKRQEKLGQLERTKEEYQFPSLKDVYYPLGGMACAGLIGLIGFGLSRLPPSPGGSDD